MSLKTKTKKKKKYDGVDLLPYLSGGDGTPHEQLFWRIGHRRALRHGDWKILRQRRGDEWELYHLSRDISESTDLAAEHPERLADLVARWEAENAGMIDPVWRP